MVMGPGARWARHRQNVWFSQQLAHLIATKAVSSGPSMPETAEDGSQRLLSLLVSVQQLTRLVHTSVFSSQRSSACLVLRS